MKDDFKFAFCNHYHSIGIAWENDDGTRDSVRITLPDDIALKMFKLTHPGLNSFEED